MKVGDVLTEEVQMCSTTIPEIIPQPPEGFEPCFFFYPESNLILNNLLSFPNCCPLIYCLEGYSVVNNFMQANNSINETKETEEVLQEISNPVPVHPSEFESENDSKTDTIIITIHDEENYPNLQDDIFKININPEEKNNALNNTELLSETLPVKGIEQEGKIEVTTIADENTTPVLLSSDNKIVVENPDTLQVFILEKPVETLSIDTNDFFQMDEDLRSSIDLTTESIENFKEVEIGENFEDVTNEQDFTQLEDSVSLSLEDTLLEFDKKIKELEKPTAILQPKYSVLADIQEDEEPIILLPQTAKFTENSHLTGPQSILVTDLDMDSIITSKNTQATDLDPIKENFQLVVDIQEPQIVQKSDAVETIENIEEIESGNYQEEVEDGYIAVVNEELELADTNENIEKISDLNHASEIILPPTPNDLEAEQDLTETTEKEILFPEIDKVTPKQPPKVKRINFSPVTAYTAASIISKPISLESIVPKPTSLPLLFSQVLNRRSLNPASEDIQPIRQKRNTSAVDDEQLKVQSASAVEQVNITLNDDELQNTTKVDGETSVYMKEAVDDDEAKNTELNNIHITEEFISQVIQYPQIVGTLPSHVQQKLETVFKEKGLIMPIITPTTTPPPKRTYIIDDSFREAIRQHPSLLLSLPKEILTQI